jgi:type 1 fimbria pilin
MKRLAIAGLGIVASIGLAGGAFAAAGGTSTVTGTLEDSYCYMTMGAHGASHKKCAIECAEKGIPVSLVEKGAEKIYVLLPPKNAQSLPKDVISKMEEEVTVTGKEYSKGGVNYLVVESIK